MSQISTCGLIGQGGAFDGDQGVDGDGFGGLGELGEGVEQGDAVVVGLAEAEDAAAADGDAGGLDVGEGAEAVLVGAGGDDVAVVFGGGVEVVVVGVEAGVLEALGLAIR